MYRNGVRIVWRDGGGSLSLALGPLVVPGSAASHPTRADGESLRFNHRTHARYLTLYRRAALQTSSETRFVACADIRVVIKRHPKKSSAPQLNPPATATAAQPPTAMAASKASRVGEEYDLEVSELHRLEPCVESNVEARTRIDKVNAELVTLTYGTIVAQLCKDFESDYAEVNRELDKMGYNIGLRLIEDYLAKSNTMKRCSNFRETADMIARVGFKIFLNITPQVTNWTNDNNQFSLVFDENPFADFVELPDDGRAQDELWYSNILCGVLRGALEMVQMQVEAHFISDVLRGNDTTEMRVSLIRYIDDELPPEDD
ncbi:Trafficking protein particle complex subunit BET3 [Tolypocladium paradoxum]|uniref:Trafficking protein particle complex subunit BET3 n=1 Tax=Tolypocladium paradoxum TaxID=94208 RepID=A0A2S4L8V4_9HYPO|nr:Trafficking protein particle complex subunit BET3 [Tolypocladium paradoxum]